MRAVVSVAAGSVLLIALLSLFLSTPHSLHTLHPPVFRRVALVKAKLESFYRTKRKPARSIPDLPSSDRDELKRKGVTTIRYVGSAHGQMRYVIYIHDAGPVFLDISKGIAKS